MTPQIRELGDSHNFGRRVSAQDGRIHKPRTVFWEWLLLSAESPLRKQLDCIAKADSGRVGFDFLPNLHVERSSAKEIGSSDADEKGVRRQTPTGPLGKEGVVDHVSLQPLRIRGAEDRRRLAEAAGRAIALFSWLGLGDLHWENLALGSSPKSPIQLVPLDIELMLDDHALPTHTRLLPEADPDYAALYQHACGIRRILPFLGKPVAVPDLVAMVAAYHRTLASLDQHSEAIAKAILTLPDLPEAPLRVCLRSTGDYLRRDGKMHPPLLAAEKEQLDRGDIPYFFRLYGRPGIHYFADAALTTCHRIPARGDVPQLAPLLSLAKGLRSANRRTLREQGLFCLLAAFDHPTFSGEHAHGDIHVRFAARRLVVRIDGEDELDTRRDLHDFVSSVYQPCRCGEVASPLVPKVTRCQAMPEPRSHRRAGG